MKSIKEPVRLREKQLANGNKSLYLDIYINGRREYEFLKLYLIPETNKEARDRNRETLKIANSVKIARIAEINSNRFQSKVDYSRDTLFFPYAEHIKEMRTKGDTKYGNSWVGTIWHLRIYAKNDNITFKYIDERFCEGFLAYLDTVEGKRTHKPLSDRSKRTYMIVFRIIIHNAVEDRILPYDITHGVKLPPDIGAERQYLSLEELKTLAQTPCRVEQVKRIFLFSCLTGLRFGDISNLKWGDVQTLNGRTRLVFRQHKTKKQEYLDINPQAAELMGTPSDNLDDKVFGKMRVIYNVNSHLREWVASAGIKKYISFHCARHTFAVMMLNLGTDLYTVSKLLGHTKITTTQIYAKIVDKTKQDAIDRIPQGIIQM